MLFLRSIRWLLSATGEPRLDELIPLAGFQHRSRRKVLLINQVFLSPIDAEKLSVPFPVRFADSGDAE